MAPPRHEATHLCDLVARVTGGRLGTRDGRLRRSGRRRAGHVKSRCFLVSFEGPLRPSRTSAPLRRDASRTSRRCDLPRRGTATKEPSHGRQAVHDLRPSPARDGHRLPRGPDRTADGPDQPSHRAPEGPPEGSPLAPSVSSCSSVAGDACWTTCADTDVERYRAIIAKLGLRRWRLMTSEVPSRARSFHINQQINNRAAPEAPRSGLVGCQSRAPRSAWGLPTGN